MHSFREGVFLRACQELPVYAGPEASVSGLKMPREARVRVRVGGYEPRALSYVVKWGARVRGVQRVSWKESSM